MMSINYGCSAVSNCYAFKSRLQEYAQKLGLVTPAYETMKVGPPHEPCFSSSVTVNNVKYYSLPGFSNRKAAEQSAAEIALVELSNSGKLEGSIAHPVHETGLCKNLLQEYAQKMNYAIPSYVSRNETSGRHQSFCCTVEVGGIRYIGAAAKTKKEAEIKAARTALLAIQSDPNRKRESNTTGDPQLTVLPGKRKAPELDTANGESSKPPKEKKARQRKKGPRKYSSRNRGESQPGEQTTSSVENVPGENVENSETVGPSMGDHDDQMGGSDVNHNEQQLDVMTEKKEFSSCLENAPGDQVEKSETLGSSMDDHDDQVGGSDVNQNKQQLDVLTEKKESSTCLENDPGDHVEKPKTLGPNMGEYDDQVGGADVNQKEQLAVTTEKNNSSTGDQVENSKTLGPNVGDQVGGADVIKNEQQLNVMTEENKSSTRYLESAPGDQVENSGILQLDVMTEENNFSTGYLENAPGDQVENSGRLEEKMAVDDGQLVGAEVNQDEKQIPVLTKKNNSSSGYKKNVAGDQVENSGIIGAKMDAEDGELTGSGINQDEQQMHVFVNKSSNGGTTVSEYNQNEEEISNMEILSGVQIKDLGTLTADVDKVSGVEHGDQVGVAEASVVAVDSSEGIDYNQEGRINAEGGNAQTIGAELKVSQGVVCVCKEKEVLLQ